MSCAFKFKKNIEILIKDIYRIIYFYVSFTNDLEKQIYLLNLQFQIIST